MRGYFKKGLVLGIIFLFLGAGVIPTTSSIDDKNKDKNLLNNCNSPVVIISGLIPDPKNPGKYWARGFQGIDITASDTDDEIISIQIQIVVSGHQTNDHDWIETGNHYVWDTNNPCNSTKLLWDIHARAQNTTLEWGYAPSITAEVDNTPPMIKILKPYKGFFVFKNIQVIYLGEGTNTVVWGPINFQIYATDPGHGDAYINEGETKIYLSKFRTPPSEQQLDVPWDNGYFQINYGRRYWGTFDIMATCEDMAGNIGQSLEYTVIYIQFL